MARDDFDQKTQRLVEQRAGHQCSNPGCNAPTSGPQENTSKAMRVGVAAHITAASTGGPRYDASLTADQRAHADNGIWLCQTCSRLVDADVARFRVDLLHDWKARAEKGAAAALGKPAERGEDIIVRWVSLRESQSMPLIEQRRSAGYALKWATQDTEGELSEDGWQRVVRQDGSQSLQFQLRDPSVGFHVLMERQTTR